MAESKDDDPLELANLLEKKRACPEAPQGLAKCISLVREFVGLELRLNRIIGPFHETEEITGLTIGKSAHQGTLFFCDRCKVYRAQIYGQSSQQVISKDVMTIFAMFDKDRDGYLRQDEFNLVLELIDPDVTSDMQAKMFAQFDVDESERIDTLEFSHAIDYWKSKDPNVMKKLVAASGGNVEVVLEGDNETGRRGARQQSGAMSTVAEDMDMSGVSFEQFLGNLKNTGYFNECGQEGSDLYTVRLQRAQSLYQQKQQGSQQGQGQQKQMEEVLPNGWHKMYDQGSKRYYYQNNQTKVTQWTPPTAEQAVGYDPAANQGASIELQQMGNRPTTTMMAPMPTPNADNNAPTPAIYDMPPQSEGVRMELSGPMNINMEQQQYSFPDVTKAKTMDTGRIIGHKRTATSSRRGLPEIFRPELQTIAGLNKTGFRDGQFEKSAFNCLEDLIVDETIHPDGKKSRSYGNLFCADRQNSCIRHIDFGTRKVTTGAWSMKPKCLCNYNGIMYGVSDGHLKSYVYNQAADMYFDYGCHDDLEGVCVDKENNRFYLAQKCKAQRVTGAKRMARKRQIVSISPLPSEVTRMDELQRLKRGIYEGEYGVIEPECSIDDDDGAPTKYVFRPDGDEDGKRTKLITRTDLRKKKLKSTALQPHRFRMSPPRLQEEFVLEYNADEEILDMKSHPSPQIGLIICTTAGIYAARIVREFTEWIHPEKDDEKSDVYVHQTSSMSAVNTQPYSVTTRKWVYQCLSGQITDCIAISQAGDILLAQGNKIMEYKIDGDLASG